MVNSLRMRLFYGALLGSQNCAIETSNYLNFPGPGREGLKPSCQIATISASITLVLE